MNGIVIIKRNVYHRRPTLINWPAGLTGLGLSPRLRVKAVSKETGAEARLLHQITGNGRTRRNSFTLQKRIKPTAIR